MHSVIVVIPAYNEEKTIGEVIMQIFNIQFPISKILVVDDGSSDLTQDVARHAGATVISHPVNRGLGAALSTGIAAALKLITYNSINHPAIIVTLDADGQHDPNEIPAVIEPVVKGEAEVVIGSRFAAKPHTNSGLAAAMPWHRQVANFCGNFFTWLLFGIWVSDSQSGFRAFSANAARKLCLRTSTMEVSSEIIREVARLKLRLAEVPITVKYTEYSLAKGQGFFRGLQTLWKLIVLKFFR